MTTQHESVQFDATSIASQPSIGERLAPESSSLNKAVSGTVSPVQVLYPSVNGPKQEKAKGSSSCSPNDIRVPNGVLIKKKVKRKTESELEGTHFRPEKLASLQGEERPRTLKQTAGVSPKSNLQPTSLPGLEQSS